MKKQLTLLIAASLFCASTQAQIPVTDGASIATNILNQAETIAQWTSQYQQMINQINQMEKEYASLTGKRNLGAIFNDPQFRQYLPSDWQSVYDQIQQGGYSGLTGDAQTIFDENKISDARCRSFASEQQRIICEAGSAKPSQDLAFEKNAYEKSKARLNQIDSLMNQINQTSDPKAIAELDARIATEQAAIQNEQTKLAMFKMISDTNEQLRLEKQQQLNIETERNEGTIPPIDLTSFE
jgi:type IV secretion system protein VirB5